MKLENLVLRFLGLKEGTEDVFFRVQQRNTTTINDQHFQTIFLAFFTRCEQHSITCAELFHPFADMLNVFRMACPRLTDELESSAKANVSLQDEVLFEKHTDFISVMVFPFKSLSPLATAIRRDGQLLSDTLHTVAYRLLHLLQRYNEELCFEAITIINAFYANTMCEFLIDAGASCTSSRSSRSTTASRSIVRPHR